MVLNGMLRNKSLLGLIILSLIVFSSACSDDPGKKPPIKKDLNPPVKVDRVQAPDFSSDSAYAFIETQVNFGPRVPGTAAHQACAKWMVNKLKTYTPTVQVQSGNVKTTEGKTLIIKNIIASFNPEATHRVMLTTHWDSRPWADEDPDPTKHDQPVPGANDASSGVGVLIEIARQLSIKAPSVGVDMFFWDAEDSGKPDQNHPDSYCLGAQFWAKNPHTFNYSPKFGINLDMVGGHGAQFPQEGFSVVYAPETVDKVWKTAAEIGYGSIFLPMRGASITDDHLYVNLGTSIPCIDIIARDPNRGTFFEHWHTVKDDMDAISKSTLKAVGQTVLEVVFREGPGS